MSSQLVEEFTKLPVPGFRCYAAGDESGDRFLASVHHVLMPPASQESIAHLRQLVSTHADKIEDFYRLHDGFILYCDTKSEAAGIALLPIKLWADATEDMRRSFKHLSDDPKNDPDHILTGVAIATVPQSGNYFVMPLSGLSAGKIFYSDHDGWYESAFADDFDEFLARVVRDPVMLLAEEVGCYTRYSDGETKKQWIPEEFFPDISRAQL